MSDSSVVEQTTFGEYLRFLRKRMQLTQQELGIALGYSTAMIARLENGERFPDPAMVKTAYIDALDLKNEPAMATRLNQLAAIARNEPHPQPVVEPTTEAAPRRRQTNLPTQLTTFIGREKEIEEITRMVGVNRLMTLTGSGGVGKTRLSLQVGEALVDAFADGVWLVELAAFVDPALVSGAISAVLGLPDQQVNAQVAALTTYLRGKHILLLLDNCEHLIAMCASLVEELLRACSNVHVLATSREALRIPGEKTVRVPSLQTPDPDRMPPLELAREYEAISLFAQYASAVETDFVLTATNVTTIARICSRLDGIPLAIEMAAAQVPAFTVDEIAAGLDNCFELLSAGSRTAPQRHQTLRTMLDWSYGLLSPAEQVLLARLSVFAGGWTSDEARTICNGEIPVLRQLVQKSLVVATSQRQQMRYSLLETVRQYATEKLQAFGELEAAILRDKHLDYCIALVEETMDLGGREVNAWVQRIERAHSNIRAAFDWARDRAAMDHAERMLRLAAGMRPFRHNRGYTAEGLAWLDEALLLGAEAPVEARALALLAKATALVTRNTYSAMETAQESLALFRPIDHHAGMAWCLELLSWMRRRYDETEEAVRLFEGLESASGLCRMYRTLGTFAMHEQGDFVKAAEYFDQAIVVARDADEYNLIANAVSQLYLINPKRGRELHEQEVARMRRLGDDEMLATMLCSYGTDLGREGDWDLARSALQESVDLWRKLGHKHTLGGGIWNPEGELALSCQATGDTARAIALWEEQIAIAQELALGSADIPEMLFAKGEYARCESIFRKYLEDFSSLFWLDNITIILTYIGESTYRLGYTQRSMRLLGAATALASTVKYPLHITRITYHPVYKQSMLDVRARLNDPDLAVAWNAGQQMTQEQAIDYAIHG